LFGSRLNRGKLPEVVAWLESGRLKPEGMVSRTFPAAEAREAFAYVEREPAQIIKVQLAFGS
jgi:L-gulonate 5-dehydrogenase